MFQLLPCPTCQRSMVLRSGVSQEATLKCPGCQSQFVLRDILSSYFEQWEVVDDPDPEPEQMALNRSAGQHTVDVSAIDDGIELVLQPEADDEPIAGAMSSKARLLRSGKAEKQKVDWSRFKPITHEEYERMRRKATSPVWTFLQIVLGGLAAIPVSLLIIWHVVDTDIGGAAPAVAQYLPWIVPERFRPLAKVDDFSVDDFVLPERGLNDFRQFEDANEPDTAAIEEGNAGTSSMPKIEEAEIADSASGNVFASIRKCQESLQAWIDGRGGDKQQLQTLAQALYGDLLALASELNQTPPDHPTGRTVRERVDDLARTIAEHEDVKSLILAGARARLRDNANLSKFDFVAVKKVAKVAESEDHWTLALEQGSTGEQVLPPIIVPTLLAPSILEGDELLILGEYLRNSVESAPEAAEFRASYVYGFLAK